MIFEELRRAAEAAPRERLDVVLAALWQAFAAGGLDEAQAAEVEAIAQARRRVAPRGEPPIRKARAAFARRREPEEVELRRRLAAGGWMPPALAARFTPGEQAVLAVVAREIARSGACALCHAEVAALAGVGVTTARNAVREARLLGLVRVRERRLTAQRNDTNVVTLANAEWLGWLRLRARKPVPGGGVKRSARSRIQEIPYPEAMPGPGRRWLPGGGDGQGRRGTPQRVAVRAS